MPTLFDKIWQAHIVDQPPEGHPLLYADRHYVHEVTSPQAFDGLRQAGRVVRRTDLTYAVADHVVPTTEGRSRPLDDPIAEAQLAALERNCQEFGIPLMNMHNSCQGVIHVTMPELGLTLPGQTVFCGDSHTDTNGAFGALAFGVGTSEVEHLLATQCLPQKKPKNMAVRVEGRLPAGVGAKDVILAIIGHLGSGGGTGYVIEFMGEAIEGLNMEERMTVCNMSVECGAKAGLIAPDETTFAYLKGRLFAPQGEDFDRAVEFWRTLPSDPGTAYDREMVLDAAALGPQTTWGTSPGQVADINSVVPELESFTDPEQRKSIEEALSYMGLKPGVKLSSLPIDCVFIGSCTNGRITDLRQAAQVIKGRKIAKGVTALAVPGSYKVKAQAEEEGLDQIFKEAGFEWRLPGCSACLGMNPDIFAPGQRTASTSNRNFQGRQGRGVRTHLVSPITAAASALTGRLTDPRDSLEG